MKTLDIVKDEPRTELEVWERWKNAVHAQLISDRPQKRIKVVDVTGYGEIVDIHDAEGGEYDTFCPHSNIEQEETGSYDPIRDVDIEGYIDVCVDCGEVMEGDY